MSNPIQTFLPKWCWYLWEHNPLDGPELTYITGPLCWAGHLSFIERRHTLPPIRLLEFASQYFTITFALLFSTSGNNSYQSLQQLPPMLITILCNFTVVKITIKQFSHKYPRKMKLFSGEYYKTVKHVNTFHIKMCRHKRLDVSLHKWGLLMSCIKL